MTWPWWLATLAEACGKVGQLDEGLRAVEEALAAVQRNEEGHYEAEVYRLKGELLLQAPTHQEAAEAQFQQALAVARRRQAEARELLAPVYAGSPRGLTPPTCRRQGPVGGVDMRYST